MKDFPDYLGLVEVSQEEAGHQRRLEGKICVAFAVLRYQLN